MQEEQGWAKHKLATIETAIAEKNVPVRDTNTTTAA